MVDLLFSNPVTSTARIRDDLEVSPQGALNLLKGLETRGWLRHLKGPTRRGSPSLWIAPEIFRIMQEDILTPLERVET